MFYSPQTFGGVYQKTKELSYKKLMESLEINKDCTIETDKLQTTSKTIETDQKEAEQSQ